MNDLLLFAVSVFEVVSFRRLVMNSVFGCIAFVQFV